jgi:hypothetical protein
MDRADYIKRALNDHLRSSTYTRLSRQEAHKAMQDTELELTNLLELYGDTLSKPEQVYFNRFLQLDNYHTKQFYITMLMTTIKSTSNSTVGTTDRPTKSRKKR